MSVSDITQRPPRPVITQAILFAAALNIARSMEKNGLIESDEMERFSSDLATYGYYWNDGYTLAKTLDDRSYWEPVSEWIDELNKYGYEVRKLLKAEQVRWATENAVTPPYADGTRVKMRDGETGTIDRVDEHGPAAYLIKIDGDPRADTSRRVVNFEDATPIESEASCPST